MATTRASCARPPRRLDSPGRGAGRVNNVLYPDIPAQHVRHLPVRRCSTRPAGGCATPTPGTTCPTSGTATASRAARHRHAARPDARHALRGAGGDPRRRAKACCSTATGWWRPTTPSARCSASRGCATAGRGAPASEPTLIELLLAELARFTGAGWEQEDDITLVTLQRSARPRVAARPERRPGADRAAGRGRRRAHAGRIQRARAHRATSAWRCEQVADAVARSGAAARRLERLKTAVAEATMNAMEHGNDYQADLPVLIRVLASPEAIDGAGHRSGRATRRSRCPRRPIWRPSWRACRRRAAGACS